jgi:two-component system NtrC family sensor kinase
MCGPGSAQVALITGDWKAGQKGDGGVSLFRTLSFKLTSGIISALVVIVSLFLYNQYRLHESHLIGGLRDSLTAQGMLLAKGLEFAMLGNHPALTQEMVMELSRERGVHRVWILDKAGNVKVSSEPELLGHRVDMEDKTCLICHQSSPETRGNTVLLADKDGTEIFRNVAAIPNHERCFSCHSPDSRINGVLIMDYSISEVRKRLKSDLWAMARLAAFMLVAIALVMILLTNRLVLGRVRSLARASRSIAKGDLVQRVSEDGRDELSYLAQQFNSMAASLQASFHKIQDQSRYLERLIDSLDDCVVVVDRERGIVMANRSFGARFGAASEGPRIKPCGPALLELPLPCYEGLFPCPAERTFELGATSRAVACLESEGGRRQFWEIIASPVKDEEGKVTQVVEVMRDITERRLLEQRLAHLERLAAVGVMASGICHEINNPLASITTCLDGLQRRVRDQGISRDGLVEEIMGYLSLMQKEISRCKELTGKLLTLSEKPKPRLDCVALHQLLRGTLSLLEEQAGSRQISFSLDLSPELETIFADSDQIQQVFINLLLNAMEAIGSTGRITISTRKKGDQAVIQVTDTGRGIPSEDLRRVFEPFFTRATGKRGVGLGLTICESIVRQHKGDISIQSQPGQGTTVTVVLPLDPNSVDLPLLQEEGAGDETGHLYPDRG